MSHRLAVAVILAVSGICLHGCSSAPVNVPTRSLPLPTTVSTVHHERVGWSRIPGWRTDEVKEAWPTFLASCRALRFRTEWSTPCAAAEATNADSSHDIRDFFERYFEPYSVQKETGALREDTGLITGYYEPLLNGAREPSPQFSAPLYATPQDLLVVDLASVYPNLKGMRLRGRLEGNRVVPYYTRAELETNPAVRGKEIVWVDDALDAFVLQVQGSGRVRLPDGETIRLQYAEQNGHPYQSIGRYLVERGELTVAEATLPGIRAWLANNPARLHEVLNFNPSVVFFKEEKLEDPAVGPKGAQGIPLTAGRSIAVDPKSIPLGAPVFLDATYPASEEPLQRLVVAQDTGGAIRGAVRADFFWGSGAAAGELAGRMRQQGRLWMLWPKDVPLPGS